MADDDDGVVAGHRRGCRTELEGIVGEGFGPGRHDGRADQRGVPRRADADDVNAAPVGQLAGYLGAKVALGRNYRCDGVGLRDDGVVHPVGMGSAWSGRSHVVALSSWSRCPDGFVGMASFGRRLLRMAYDDSRYANLASRSAIEAILTLGTVPLR